MVMGCRMTVRREGDHADGHQLNGQGGANNHWHYHYKIQDNDAVYAIAGYAVIQTENIYLNIVTQGTTVKVSSNNPGIGRPDVTVDDDTRSFSEGDEYTWTKDFFKFHVKRLDDGDDFKEFVATILPV